MANDLSLVILAGGNSTRMGSRKVELRLGGRFFVEDIHQRLGARFDETLVVGSLPIGTSLEMRWVPDLFPSRTPLVGIYSGLAATRSSRCFVIACDMPMVSPRLVELMAGYAPDADVVVPGVNGFLEPLCAIYHKRTAEPLREALTQGIRKVTAGIERLGLLAVPEALLRTVDPDLRSFTNVNSPDDLERLATIVRQRSDGSP